MTKEKSEKPVGDIEEIDKEHKEYKKFRILFPITIISLIILMITAAAIPMVFIPNNNTYINKQQIQNDLIRVIKNDAGLDVVIQVFKNRNIEKKVSTKNCC